MALGEMLAVTHTNTRVRALMISCGIVGHDGRMHEIREALRVAADCRLVCFAFSDAQEATIDCVQIDDRAQRTTLKAQWRLLCQALQVARRWRPDILLIDDFSAAGVGFFLKLILKPSILVQDARELYVGKRMPGLGNVLLFFERWLARRADLLICANRPRAIVMRQFLRLPEEPITFPNIRILPPPVADDAVPMALRTLFTGARQRILATGGCSVMRGTLDTVRGMADLPEIDLIIVGKGHDNDYKAVRDQIRRLGLTNVHVVDRVPLNVLSWMVARADIGAIEYHQRDLNNYFCDSGKAFEYLTAGLPIVATDNLPLRELCDRHGVGVAGPDFVQAVKSVFADREAFRHAVDQFAASVSVERNRAQLASAISDCVARCNRAYS